MSKKPTKKVRAKKPPRVVSPVIPAPHPHATEFADVVGPGFDITQWRRLDNGAWVHNTAIVKDGSRIGARSSIGAMSSIGEWSHIGDGSFIGDGSSIGDGSRIGDESRIGAWSRIGDGSRIGEWSRIGDGSSIGARSSIGDGSFIGDGSRIGIPDAVTQLHRVGSRRATLTAVLYPDKIMVGTGCFWGEISALEAAVAAKHAGTRWIADYAAAFAYLRAWGESTRAAHGPALAEGIATLANLKAAKTWPAPISVYTVTRGTA